MIEPAYFCVLALTGCDVEARDSSAGPWQKSGREGVLAKSSVWRYQTRIPMSSAVSLSRAPCPQQKQNPGTRSRTHQFNRRHAQ